MNGRIFCAITLLSLFFAGRAVIAAEEKPTTEKVKESTSDAVEATKEGTKKAAHAVAQTTRQAWKKTKAYFSENTTTYREGATKRLDELNAEINQLKEKNVGDRDYFATRIRSLEQQHQYARDQLAGAAAEDLKLGKESRRSRINQTIDRLEDNIDLAQKEVKDFVPDR
jgi:hypothetical protein